MTILVLLFGGMLGACDSRSAVTTTPTVTLATVTPPAPTATRQEASPTTVLPTVTALPVTPDSSPSANCLLGTGLRQETAPILLEYKDHSGLVMSASAGLAELYFPELVGWIRVLGAPSLETLQQKAERAMRNDLPYEGLGYGLETSETTPNAEWRDLVGSTRKAGEISDQYSKILVMGPGFRLMSRNEEKYPEMVALSDLWIFQTQQLQKNPPGIEYRQEVERVVNLIRAGDADIPIWAQITLPPDREPDAEEWLAYRESIADLVDGTYIGVYTWDSNNEDKLVATIEMIFASLCESN